MGYSRIVETTGNGNGSKVYTYTTCEDFPDEPVLEGNDSTITYSSSTTTDDICSTIHLTSLHLERGKLKSVEEYLNDDTLIRESIYEYNSIDQHRRDAIFSNGYRLLLLGKYLGNSVAHYYYPKHVTAITTREYAKGQTICRKTEYSYNLHNQQISVEQIQNSDGKNYTKKIYYPKDFPSDTTLAAMVNSNMLNTIVKEESYISSNLEHTREYMFSKYHNQYYDICAIKEAFGDNGHFYPVVIHSRDKHRNIESLTEFGKPAEHYLWGHGYQYPVAKLENITTAEFLEKLPEATRDAIGADFSLGKSGSILENLNSSQYFPNAHVTLYKYMPQVGMTYSKAPNGKNVYYNYRNYNRLASIAEVDENNILTTFQYNVLHKDYFNAYWQNCSNLLFTGTQSLVCKTEGGSRDFNYKLTLTRNGVSVATSTTGKLTYNFTTEGVYVFSGTVKDNVTGATASFSNSFNVIKPCYVEFSQTEENMTVDHGCYKSLAKIICTKETEISFIFNYTLENGSFSCHIGQQEYYSGTASFGEQSFTITLPVGEHEIELNLNNIIGNATLELIIEDVKGENAYLGEDLYLNLSTDKTN